MIFASYKDTWDSQSLVQTDVHDKGSRHLLGPFGVDCAIPHLGGNPTFHESRGWPETTPGHS